MSAAIACEPLALPTEAPSMRQGIVERLTTDGWQYEATITLSRADSTQGELLADLYGYLKYRTAGHYRVSGYGVKATSWWDPGAGLLVRHRFSDLHGWMRITNAGMATVWMIRAHWMCLVDPVDLVSPCQDCTGVDECAAQAVSR